MYKNKKVQISYELFLNIVRFFLFEYYDNYGDIKSQLEIKVDKMIKHDIYTKSKTAPSAEEREKARQEYLDKVGIPKGFRW